MKLLANEGVVPTCQCWQQRESGSVLLADRLADGTMVRHAMFSECCKAGTVRIDGGLLANRARDAVRIEALRTPRRWRKLSARALAPREEAVSATYSGRTDWAMDDFNTSLASRLAASRAAVEFGPAEFSANAAAEGIRPRWRDAYASGQGRARRSPCLIHHTYFSPRVRERRWRG